MIGTACLALSILFAGQSPTPSPRSRPAASDASRAPVESALRRGVVHLVTTPKGDPFPFPVDGGSSEFRFHTRAEDAASATTEPHAVRKTDLREVERRRKAGEAVRVVGGAGDRDAAKEYSPSGEYTSSEAPGFLIRANDGYTTIATSEGTFVPIFLSIADAKELQQALGKHPDGRPVANIVCAPVDKLAALVSTGEQGVRLLRFLGYGAVPPPASARKPSTTSKAPKGSSPTKPTKGR